MTDIATPGARAPGAIPAAARLPFEQAQPLERRRLQAYLALMVGDIVAIFAAFSLSGWLYLAAPGFSQAALLAQLLLPVFLIVALYNGAYSISTLQSSQDGMLRAMSALGISAAAVVFIAYYTKSSAVRLSVRTTEKAGIATGPPIAPITITEPWIVTACAPGITIAASAGRISADSSL